MRLIDRYIFKSVISLFLTCLGTFLFLYVIIDIFSNLEDILKNKIAIGLLLQYYLTYLPIIFVQVSPMASLLATLYTFGKLNRNNEIIAMRAAGLSIFQITKTVIVMGALLSLLVFFVSDRFVPQSATLSQKIKSQIQGDTQKTKPNENVIINNLSMYGMKNRLFFINKFATATNTMEGITILEHDEKQNIIQKIVANKGIYEGNAWKFSQSITYNFDESGMATQEPQYVEEEFMAIPETPKDFLTQRQRPDHMTISQLDDYIWKLSKSGAKGVIRNLKIELYQRYTAPLTSIVIIFLGIPFALKMKKRATGISSLGVSIMMSFLYYVMNAVCIALGKEGFLPAILAVSLSHAIAMGISLYLITELP